VIDRPVQRSGQCAGQQYQKTQREYADRYGVTILTVKRWWKRGLPCDDPDAMGEFLSNAGRKPDDAGEGDHSDAADTLAESRVNRLDESFLEGEGLAAAIKRINKIELALADAIRQALNQKDPHFRTLGNRLGAWISMLDSMRKLEKDTPGILEKNKSQIDIAEVEEGITRLLLAIIGRLQILPTRGMQTLAAFTDPQDIREELEKEIAEALAPIRECKWMPEEFRSQIPEIKSGAAEPCAKKDPGKKSNKRTGRTK
jgi:hypothetical protein